MFTLNLHFMKIWCYNVGNENRVFVVYCLLSTYIYHYLIKQIRVI